MGLKVVTVFGPTPGGPFTSLSNWTEIYYSPANLNATGMLTRLTTGQPDANFLLYRTNIMTPGWSIIGIKVSDTDNTRDVAEAILARPGTFTSTGAKNDEQPYDRLLYKMQAFGKKRAARVGAIPTGVVDPGGNYRGFPPGASGRPAAWHELFVTGFGKMLAANELGLRYISDRATRPIKALIISVIGLDNGSARSPILTFAAQPPAIFAGGREVRVTGAKGTAGLNGTWHIDQIYVNGGEWRIQLKAKRKNEVTGILDPGAQVTAYEFNFSTTGSVYPKRGTSRKPGRPFDLPRGRASNRPK